MMNCMDSLNQISVVKVERNSLVVGTQSGLIIVYNTKDFKPLFMYYGHEKKVSDLWVQHKRAIVSCSADNKLFIKAMTNEFDDSPVEIEELKGSEFMCIEVIDN